MTEKEMVVLARLISEEVEDIVGGKHGSGNRTLLLRLRRYAEQYDSKIGEEPQ